MCILINKTTQNPIPLKNQNVHVDAYNQTANVTVTQSYENDETKPIEAIFTFPTLPEASVHSLEALTSDNKLIKCHIKEKNEARENYNQAISEGNTAFYMDRSSGDVLSVVIGNLAPKSSVEITVKYVVELKNEETCRKLRITFPLTIMPRYSPQHVDSIKHRSVNPEMVSTKPFTMSISGHLVMSDGIVSLDAKTHKLRAYNMQYTSVDFAMDDLDNLNEDVVIIVERNAPRSVAFTEQMNTNNPNYRFCTVANIVPDFGKMDPVNVNDVHYYLLLDKSGSMAGQDMEICKKAAQNFVALLPIGSKFDVFAFNSHFEKFEYESENMMDRKQKATEWINRIDADGGTNLLPAMANIYDSLKEKTGVMIVLSDGGISNTDEVFRLVKLNPNISIFTIGIGSNVSQDLIQGLATHGFGHAEFIGSGDKNIIQKVQCQLKLSQDTLRKFQNDYALDIKSSGIVTIIPSNKPTLFDGVNNTVYVFSNEPVTEILYSEKIGNANIKHSIDVQSVDNSDCSLHRIAGVKFLNDLTASEKSFRTTGSNVSKMQVESIRYKEQMILVSSDLNVLCEHTAFIGVEYRIDKVTGPTLVREVPLQIVVKSRSYESSLCSMSLASTSIRSCSAPTGATGWSGVPVSNSKKGRSIRKETFGTPNNSSDELFSPDNNTKKSRPTVKFVVSNPLTDKYVTLNSGLLTSVSNCILQLDPSLVAGDFIQLTKESSTVNGIYEIISLGSVDQPWVLQLVN